MELQKNSNGMVPKALRGGSREAIVEAASRLFLQRDSASLSMDELAEAAGVARRTLYNQFSNKEEIFREMLLTVSGHLEEAFPPGIETQGDVEEVLRLVARMILELHERPEYLGFLRMVVADARQFPLDRRGVRRRHGPPDRAARALCRAYERDGRPRMPQSAPGGSPVHGNAQRVLAVALDDGPTAPSHPRRGGRRRHDPDVPSALSARVTNRVWS